MFQILWKNLESSSQSGKINVLMLNFNCFLKIKNNWVNYLISRNIFFCLLICWKRKRRKQIQKWQVLFTRYYEIIVSSFPKKKLSVSEKSKILKSFSGVQLLLATLWKIERIGIRGMMLSEFFQRKCEKNLANGV